VHVDIVAVDAVSMSLMIVREFDAVSMSLMIVREFDAGCKNYADFRTDCFTIVLVRKTLSYLIFS